MAKYDEADTMEIADQFKHLASASLAKWLEHVRDNDGTDRMKNRLCAMIAMCVALPPIETDAMKLSRPFPTFGTVLK